MEKNNWRQQVQETLTLLREVDQRLATMEELLKAMSSAAQDDGK